MNETQPSTTRRRSRSRSRSRSKGRSSLECKPIRVWCPGSYDLLHFGQNNFLRKVRDDMSVRFQKVEIVVGLYSNEDLIASGHKPVFTLDERFEMLRANKWVHEIVKRAPYELSKEVLKENNCDYAFTLPEDNKLRESDEHSHELLDCGLLKMFTPTPEYSGASTAQIVNRMLLLEPRDENNNTASGRDWAPEKITFPNGISCKELIRFGAGGSIPKPTDRIVYVDGSFDLLHPGHLALLEKARALGDFLYVGLYTDEEIKKCTGSRFPIMQWNERLVSLLSCKYVSEVLINAPIVVTESLLDEFSIGQVVASIEDYLTGDEAENDNIEAQRVNRYKVPKQRGILCELPLISQQDIGASKSQGILTTMDILNRIHQNWTAYIEVVCKTDDADHETVELEKIKDEKDGGDVVSSELNLAD